MIKLNKKVRYLLLGISFFILIIYLIIISSYYLVIVSDIPPQPTVYELHTFEKMVIKWLIILVCNYFIFTFTSNKDNNIA